MPEVFLRFCCDPLPELLTALQSKSIAYQGGEYEAFFKRNSSITFCVPQTALHDEDLAALISASQITCFKTNVFSEQEMQQARWFSLQCYNQKDLDEMTTSYEYSCQRSPGRSRHRRQVAPFVLSKTPRWGANHNFIAPYGRGTVLFTNAKAGRIMQQNGLTGIRLAEVLRKADRQPYDDFFQIMVENRLSTQALDLHGSDACRQKICPICGRVQYVLDGSFLFTIHQKFLDETTDIYQTDDLFGDGFASGALIVSRCFRQCILQNALGKGLNFEPVILVSD